MTSTELRSVHIVASYPVRWSAFQVLRDFVQNFFDAAGPDDFARRVQIRVVERSLQLEMEDDGFDLDWLVHLGASTKTQREPGKTAGYFGEGFKIAALCATRDFGWRVRAGSRRWEAEVVLATEQIDGVPVSVLHYAVTHLTASQGRTWLTIDGLDDGPRAMALEVVVPSFAYRGNPWMGRLLCETDRVAVWERSQTPLPTRLAYRLSPQHDGLLYLGLQARATTPLPFVVSMPRHRLQNRDRPSLYDFQMVDALAEEARFIPGAVASRLLMALREHWPKQTPRKYRCGRWSSVVSALVAAVRASPEAVDAWHKSVPKLLVASREKPRSEAAQNRRRRANAWARVHRPGVPVVQDAFRALGYPTLEEACELAGGLPQASAPTGIRRERVGLLEDFVDRHFTPLLGLAKRPRVSVMDASASGWGGIAEIFPLSSPVWSDTGRRLKREVRTITLNLHELDSPSPHAALSTYLHERCHAFGGDRSARFSAALTDALALLSNAGSAIMALEDAWTRASDRESTAD